MKIKTVDKQELIGRLFDIVADMSIGEIIKLIEQTSENNSNK